MVKYNTARGSPFQNEVINMLLQPHFFKLVDHNWTGAYLLKNYGAHFRKYLRLLSKLIFKTGTDWTGACMVWGSPIVPNAPPLISQKI